jgi:hypothetical protein
LSVDGGKEHSPLSQSRIRRVQICEFSNQVHSLLSAGEDDGDDDEKERGRTWYQPEDFARFRSEAIQQLSEWLDTTTVSLRHEKEDWTSTTECHPINYTGPRKLSPLLIPTGLERLYHRLVLASAAAAEVAARATTTAATTATLTTTWTPRRHHLSYTRWIIETHKKLTLTKKAARKVDTLDDESKKVRDGARMLSVNEKHRVSGKASATANLLASHQPGLPTIDADDELRALSEALTQPDRIRAWRSAALVVRVE